MKRNFFILAVLLTALALQARTVYIIRHGQVGINIKEIKETRLTDLGIKQAQAAADFLVNKLKFDGKIYASPLYRTIETAKPTALLLKKKIILEPGIQEMAPGAKPAPPGMTLAQINGYFPDLTEPGPRFADGWRLCKETNAMRLVRVTKALDAILAEEKGDILLTGHGASVNDLVKALNNKRPSRKVKAVKGTAWNCALFIFELDDKNEVTGGRYTTEYLDDRDVTSNFRCPKIERPDDPQYMTRAQDKADRAKRNAKNKAKAKTKTEKGGEK